MRKLRNSELNRLRLDEFHRAEKIPLTIILDNVRSANNIGSVFRTSDAFLIEKIILCGISCTPPNKDIRKTALGAEDSVQWGYAKDIHEVIKDLKMEGFTVYAVEQVAESISLEKVSLETGKPAAFIFGNEVKGVQQSVVDMCDAAVEIPQFGTKHSLNISISAGIVIWELFSKYQLQKNR